MYVFMHTMCILRHVNTILYMYIYTMIAHSREEQGRGKSLIVDSDTISGESDADSEWDTYARPGKLEKYVILPSVHCRATGPEYRYGR